MPMMTIDAKHFGGMKNERKEKKLVHDNFTITFILYIIVSFRLINGSSRNILCLLFSYILLKHSLLYPKQGKI